MLRVAVCILVVMGVQAGRPDGDSGFFLKAPKSVPRAGRSAPGQYDGFFLKASKSVPRVGRRDGNGMNALGENYEQWQKDNQEDDWKYADTVMTPLTDEILYNLVAARNYPGYGSEQFDKNLSHRSRRYNMDTLLPAGKSTDVDKSLSREIEEAHYQADV